MCAPLKPGAYLRLRREAAGLSLDDVAFMVSADDVWTAFNKALLDLIEADEHVPGPPFVDRLRGAFAFDPFIYRQLAAGFPVRTCRTCGCSALDACDDEENGPCGWAADPDLCTRCAGATPLAPRHIPNAA